MSRRRSVSTPVHPHEDFMQFCELSIPGHSHETPVYSAGLPSVPETYSDIVYGGQVSDEEDDEDDPMEGDDACSGRPGPFLCDFPDCGKSFKRLQSLKSHMRCHEDARPFECVECNISFRRKHDYLRHVRSLHATIKPFRCMVCYKPFGRSDALKRHMNTKSKAHACKGYPEPQWLENYAQEQAMNREDPTLSLPRRRGKSRGSLSEDTGSVYSADAVSPPSQSGVVRSRRLSASQAVAPSVENGAVKDANRRRAYSQLQGNSSFIPVPPLHAMPQAPVYSVAHPSPLGQASISAESLSNGAVNANRRRAFTMTHERRPLPAHPAVQNMARTHSSMAANHGMVSHPRTFSTSSFDAPSLSSLMDESMSLSSPATCPTPNPSPSLDMLMLEMEQAQSMAQPGMEPYMVHPPMMTPTDSYGSTPGDITMSPYSGKYPNLSMLPGTLGSPNMPLPGTFQSPTIPAEMMQYQSMQAEAQAGMHPQVIPQTLGVQTGQSLDGMQGQEKGFWGQLWPF